MASNDPGFERKVADIIGLYLDPLRHAAVFCVDEKTAIQRRGAPVVRALLSSCTRPIVSRIDLQGSRGPARFYGRRLTDLVFRDQLANFWNEVNGHFDRRVCGALE